MLTLFNSAIGSILALAALLSILCAPFALLWFCISICRSLHRIADNLELTATGSGKRDAGEIHSIPPVVVSTAPRVANSMFAR